MTSTAWSLVDTLACIAWDAKLFMGAKAKLSMLILPASGVFFCQGAANALTAIISFIAIILAKVIANCKLIRGNCYLRQNISRFANRSA